MGSRLLRVGAAALALLLPVAACDGDSTGPRGEPLLITTDSLPPAFVATPYSASVSVEGGVPEYDWEIVEGSLPDGLELSLDENDSGILITGVPERLTMQTFTISVRSSDGQTTSAELSIRVNPPPDPLAIENLILPPTLVGAPYEVELRTAGGTQSGDTEWVLVSGTLPPGLQLTNGVIAGTPTGTDTAVIILRLTSGGESAERTFTLRVLEDDPNTFRITTAELTEVPQEIRPHFQEAIARWEAALDDNLPAGGIPPDLLSSRNCGGFGTELNGAGVDDLLVLVNIDSIDGPGAVLGMAGPCVIRDSTLLPAAGILTLDSGDLLPLAGSETLTHIITHELGHVLGFGTLWNAKDLVVDPDSADPRFSGTEASREWEELGGTGDGVPLETTGGQGTALSHWRESVLDREIMTGFSEAVGVNQPLSRVSIASMADLGYQVNLDAADPFTLSSALLAPSALHDDIGYDVVLREPIIILRPGAPPGTLPPPHGRVP